MHARLTIKILVFGSQNSRFSFMPLIGQRLARGIAVPSRGMKTGSCFPYSRLEFDLDSDPTIESHLPMSSVAAKSCRKWTIWQESYTTVYPISQRKCPVQEYPHAEHPFSHDSDGWQIPCKMDHLTWTLHHGVSQFMTKVPTIPVLCHEISIFVGRLW